MLAAVNFNQMEQDELEQYQKLTKFQKDVVDALITEPQMGYDTVLSAGICDTCSIPKIMNTGDGINEPYDPILYCHKMQREICPEPPEDRMIKCQFYTCR